MLGIQFCCKKAAVKVINNKIKTARYFISIGHKDIESTFQAISTSTFFKLFPGHQSYFHLPPK